MMKRFQNSILSDVAFLLFIGACVVMLVFISNDPNQYIYNMLFLNVAFLIAVITYFSSIMLGLILNILFVFGYGSFTLYQTAIAGQTVGSQNYFWLIMTPVLTVLVWLFTYSNRRLQEENERLTKLNGSLVTIDQETSLKNLLSFQQDVTTFMALSVRYKIPMTLLIINVKYWDEMKKFISADKLTVALQELSEISQSLVRTNDTLYLLNNEYPTWGIVLFTDIQGSNVVVTRLKQKMEELNRSEFKEKYKVELNLKIGAVEYHEEETPTPLDLIAKAKRTLEFDV